MKITFEKIRPFFYGLAELCPSAIDLFIKVYLLLFFNKVVGLSASLTSLVIGLSVLWDALIDPWIGKISDRYYHKNGSRQNLLIFSTLLVALLFYSLWRITYDGSIWAYVFLFLLSTGLNSAISFFSIPYYAIANDLEKDNQKRQLWIGWRLIFLNIGAVVGLAVPALFLTSTAEQLSSKPYFDAVNVLSVLMICVSAFSIFGIFYKKQVKLVEINSVLAKPLTFKEIISDKIFMQVLTCFFIVNCGLGLNSSLAMYYYKNYLNFSEKQTQIILVSFLLFFTISIPLWVYLIRFFQKKNLIVTGAVLLGLMSILGFPYFKDQNFYLIFSVASILGGLLVGVAVVIEIYFSDYLNEKEKVLKLNVSGQLLGLWKMLSKISRAIAISLAGPIIEISAGHPQTLAYYFGWGVGVFFVLSGLIFLIPINSSSK